MRKLAKKENNRLRIGTATVTGKNVKLFVKILVKTIAQLAPKTAAFDIPKVNGLARGLFNPVCVSIPANPRVHPIITAINASGKRMSNSMICSVVDKLEGETSPYKIVKNDKFDGPVMISRVKNIRQRTIKTNRRVTF
jgi:hypothetical protein